jgi:large subunit ribosomal protein L9
MEVILMQEVLGLGDPGDVVTVAKGYGRNYLIPQKMAILATQSNLNRVETDRKRMEAAQAAQAERIRAEADNLEGISVTITARAGEGGKLYGSVTNMDVAKALLEMGHDIDRRRILMEQPIKDLGLHEVNIKLHPQVVVGIKVTVEAEEDKEALAAQAAQAAAAPAEAAQPEKQEPEAAEAPEQADSEPEPESEPKAEAPEAPTED